MRVLVACEFSGIVREAFRRRGHEAWSCDLLPTETPAIVNGELNWPAYSNWNPPHFQCDVFHLLGKSSQIPMKWDMMIFFWPCTNMAVSGARWFHLKRTEQTQDVAAFKALMECPIEHVAGENPIGVLSTRYRKPDQIIQPWMFGHGETKATCLWLKNLPLLKPTKIVDGRVPRVHYATPSPNRWKERSRTLPGIAEAMAEQWGSL